LLGNPFVHFIIEAQPAAVDRLVLDQVLKLAVAGIVLGLVADGDYRAVSKLLSCAQSHPREPDYRLES